MLTESQESAFEALGSQIAEEYLNEAHEVTDVAADYDFSNDADWQAVRDLAREVGIDWAADEVCCDDDAIDRELWKAVTAGYRSVVSDAHHRARYAAAIDEITSHSLEAGEALYLDSDGEIEVGRDGCAPNYMMCVAIGPIAAGADWDDLLADDDVRGAIFDKLGE